MSSMTNPWLRRAAVVTAAAALVGGLAACGTSTSGSSPSPSASGSTAAAADHNAADVSFAQMMIPHHEQAIVMAKMVPAHTQDAKLRALASQIEAAQGPEIATMKGWLAEWGASPAPSNSSMMGMDHNSHGGMATSGMMTDQQMMDLDGADGSAFDKMWLQMMIAHHEGAITMAKQELADGQNAQAKALAQAIIDGQTKEINQMKQMLGQQ